METDKKYIIRHRYFNNAEILLFVEKNMTNTRQRNGDGRFAEIMANQLEVSTSTIYQAIYILKYASDKILEEVLLDEISIKKAYKYIKNRVKNDLINFLREYIRS